jgi:oxygen-independent coproporphyrinogen-3 oxidase
MATAVGVYLHVPFCTAKCHYCDFNSYAGLDRMMPSYVEALRREIDRLPHLPPAPEPPYCRPAPPYCHPERRSVATGSLLRYGASTRGRDPSPSAQDDIETGAQDDVGKGPQDDDGRTPADLVARTINFGGGTPSLLPPDDVRRILAAVRGRFALRDGTEVSLEANPGTVAEARLADLRAAGVNRISFGVQSFDPTILAELGRIHGPEEAARARRAARAAGFESVNLDFIYGLPRQTLAVWRQTLDRALELRPEHLSLYALTVEPGTLFHRRAQQGLLPLPDEDLVADMYELASEQLEAAGYEQYEISNWALAPEHRCQHNLGYWHNLPYLGVGPGAHSWFGGRRYVDTLSPRAWVEQIGRGEPPVFGVEEIGGELELAETLMLGLRLTEGIDLAALSVRFGLDLAARFAAPIQETRELGLTELRNGRLRLTGWARLLGNEVFRRFLEAAQAI